MANSGYLRKSMSSYYDFYIYWEVTSQNTTNNTSTVSLTWGTQKKQANSVTYNLNSYLTAKYESTTLKNAAAVQFDQRSDAVGTYKPLYTTSVTVTHNNDGTKNLSLYGYLNVDNLTSASNAEINNSVTLPTIPRTSSFSATNAYVGDTSKITINKNSPSFTSTLSYKISGQSVFTQIVSKTSSTSYNWTIPTTAYDYMASSSKTVSITLQCVTYDGNTQVGSAATTTITATAKESACKPTVSTSVSYGSTTNDLTGVTNKGILNFSTATISVSATAKNGATISNRKVTLAGETKSGSSVSFSSLAASTYTYTVTDSRGFTTSGSVNLSTVAYIKPTIIVTATPPNVSTGTTNITVKGNFFNGSFGSTTNAMTLQYQYKESTASSYTSVTMTPTITNNTYTATASIALDATKTYNIRGRIKDSANTSYIYATAQGISTVPIVEWTKNSFDFNVPVTFNQGASGFAAPAIYATSDTTADTAAKVLTTDNEFTYPPATGTVLRVKFSSGNSATNPSLNINNTGAKTAVRYDSTLNAMDYMWQAGELVEFLYDGTYWVMIEGGRASTAYYGQTKLQNSISSSTSTALTPAAVNDYVKNGTWTPAFNTSAAISSYTSRSGWYSLVGDVVSGGFYIQASTNSGYTSTAIKITGLPYTPAYSTFFGGIGGNVYTSANQVFACWNIDTSGNITGRSQPCNKSSAGALSITSGVYYPASATLTVGGTFTFKKSS